MLEAHRAPTTSATIIRIIPGITAATGCAAATGIPLTHRDHAQAVTFITGHRKNGNLDINWALAAQTEHTAVFYMGLSCLGEIVSGLRKHGLPAAGGGGNAGDYFAGDSRLVQGLGFFATSSKNKRVTTFEAHHLLALLTKLDK